MKSPNFFETDLAEIIPGKLFKFPVQAKDELNATVNVVYDTSLDEKSSVKLAGNITTLSHVSGQSITVRHEIDKPEDGVAFLSNKRITLSINITVTECPPGHVKDELSDQCTCDSSHFKGIWKCDSLTKTASIINGYWIGLCTDGIQCSGNCPVGLCTSQTSTHLTERINKTSHFELICNRNRKGKLCGQCTANHSVYYHSNSYKCGEESQCQYGFLFYILSEILPLTIIFIVIITFNISFTSGAVNGIILYAQIYDASIISYYNIEVFPKGITKLFQVSKLVYATTNLNYFSIEEMSFCLWRGATTLDIIVCVVTLIARL